MNAMNTKIFVTVLVTLWLASGVCLADRQLDRPEILTILKTVTAEPHKTWIPAGTMVATHEEYKAAAAKEPNTVTAKGSLSEEKRVTTNVTVRFGGEKFYWQIDVVPRTDSVKPDQNMANSGVTSQVDPNANCSRTFAWDGQKYSTYFRPVNNAIIKDATKNKIPPVVNGPLTAGFIPWGYGYYTYEKLSAATSTGVETAVGGQKQIQLTLNHPNGSLMTFAMDTDKNYAVLSHSVKKADGSISVNTYGNFLLIGGRWIPTTLMLEQYNYFVAPQNLLASDLWDFTSIDNSMPAEDGFKIDYDADALMEYHNSITAKSVIYRYSKSSANGIDSDSLLIDKLDTDAAGNSLSQNCATAAMRYIASQLGKNITAQQLARLPQDANGSTNLYALKQFAQSQGLYCRAVRTDVQTLKGLAGCQAVLHIPGKNHYVVLGNIDDTYVRLIDLASRKFFDRFRIADFGLEWSDGTALLVSSQPINAQGALTDITDAELQTIIGRGYACTKLLQEYALFGCSAPFSGWGCGGTYSEYFERWGCEKASSGSCGSSMLVRYQELPCIVDPYDPITCTTTGDWIVYFIRACQ